MVAQADRGPTLDDDKEPSTHAKRTPHSIQTPKAAAQPEPARQRRVRAGEARHMAGALANGAATTVDF